MPHTTDYDPYTDYDPFKGVYTAPDGSLWATRTVIDPFFKRDWAKRHPDKPWPWVDYGPEYKVAWPRLRQLRIEVDSYDAEPVPGRIRAMRITLNDEHRRARMKPWVHHLEDAKKYGPAPDIKESFKSAEIQTAMVDGKATVIIAPRLVAERLGIDVTLVSIYAKNGIPWMPDTNSPTGKRIPKRVPAQNGHYGRPDDLFWVKSEIEEFKAAWDALPELPPLGLLVVGSIDGISTSTLADMGREEVLCKTYREENRKGKKRRVGYTVKRRLVQAKEVAEYRGGRLQQPDRPPNTMTVKEVAQMLGVSEVQVLRLFPKASRVKGKILCQQRDFNGKLCKQVQNGHFIPIDKVKEEWKKKHPGELWPLPDTNGQPISGEQIESMVATVMRQMAASGTMPSVGKLVVNSAHHVFVGTAANADILPPGQAPVVPNEPGADGTGGQGETRLAGGTPGGRPNDKKTWTIYKFCYRKYVTENKGAPTVKRLANQKFGANTIREDAHVRLYARRYAEKHGLPRKHQESSRK